MGTADRLNPHRPALPSPSRRVQAGARVLWCVSMSLESFACLPFRLIRVNAYWYYFGLEDPCPCGVRLRATPRAPRGPHTERKEASVTTQSSERESLSHLPGYVDERNRHAYEAGLELEKQARKDGSLSTWFCGS